MTSQQNVSNTASSFQNKVAIVTGGTQGLGAEIATLLAKRGAQALVICGRNQANGLAQAQKITHETDVPVHFVQADLANVEDCRRVVAETDSRFGKIDILINAAGLTDRGNILDTSPELFDKLFAVNVRAPFFLMQEVVKVMRRQSIEGCIVNIGSMSAMAGQPFLAAYCASKGALATLTKNTAYALLRNRIRVNGLNIGWMASDGEDRIQRDFHHADDDWLAKAAAQQPFGRLISPQEVARSVAYLCSEESGLMTGSIIEFDQSVWGAYDGSPHPVAPL
jgi:NAD(P)-dependent dehydrogenase (short-subunit alcohol dehydrogenase family)